MDKNGNVDPKRNKMWVRFVDPITLSELAPRYQVKQEDLSDDSAIWYSPSLPADTKALMQISLNNEDWHNVPMPKKQHSFTYYESPHVIRVSPTYGPVKHKDEIIMDIEGTNFKCPDTQCSDLFVRFGEPGQAIFKKGTWVSDSHIRVAIPKYTKPDVLRVEITVNNKDWTNDGKTYGYFDPFILRAEPALISVDGTTKVRIKGFGFVNSTDSKSLLGTPSNLTLVCQGKPCVRESAFIDKQTLETTTFPQNVVSYKETDSNVQWDPMTIDASIYGSGVNDFTDNGVQVFYYEEPEYKELNIDESPANLES